MAPASRARSTSSRWLNAVSTITGAIRAAAICSAADSPSSSGIWMSRMTRSGRWPRPAPPPDRPSPTSATTVYPSSSSISLRSRRMRASSSAMRTRVGSLLTPRSLAMRAVRHLPARLRERPVTRADHGGRGPPYPNRQRERTQNPRSVRSSRTGGTVEGCPSPPGGRPRAECPPGAHVPAWNGYLPAVRPVTARVRPVSGVERSPPQGRGSRPRVKQRHNPEAYR